MACRFHLKEIELLADSFAELSSSSTSKTLRSAGGCAAGIAEACLKDQPTCDMS